MQKAKLSGKAILAIGAAALAVGVGAHELKSLVALNQAAADLGSAAGITCGALVGWLLAGRDRNLAMMIGMMVLSPLVVVIGPAIATLPLLAHLDASIALWLATAFIRQFVIFCFFVVGLDWFFTVLERRRSSNRPQG